MILVMCYTVIIDYYKKKFPPIQKKQGVNNYFVCFTTVVFRLKSEQKEKEKYVLKLNTTLVFSNTL